MRAKFEEVRERLRGLWGSLETWQKASLVGAGVAVLGGILLLVFMAGRTSYEPLFANLHITDQSAVVSYLKEQKIPFKVDSTYSAILVPRDKVYEARIALAGRGIPNNGTTGYELLDNSKVGATDFQQRVAYNRALEGELARTIQWVNAVDTARVTIVIPETRLFLEQQQPSTASVMLKMAPGMEIGQEEVKAIVHLVASSIEGLKPENVTVVDTDGQNLTDLIADGSLLFLDSGGGRGRKDVTSVQRRLEQQQELEFEQKLRTLLERVYGPGRAKVAVRVQLDFDKKSNNQRTYIPLTDTKTGVVRSTQNTEESYTGPANFPGGIPGTTTNIPGYVANTGQGSGNAEYNRADTVTNYDITTHESQQVETPGKVKRLSASVIIDGKLKADEIANWKDAVANAIGFDEVRGDRLTVIGMPFDTSVEDAMVARLGAEKQRQLIMVAVSSLFLAILAGVLLFIWLRRRRAAALARGRQSSAAGAEQVPSLRELLDNPDLMTSQGELAVLEEQLRNYAMNNPEEMANLIKNWIVDD